MVGRPVPRPPHDVFPTHGASSATRPTSAISPLRTTDRRARRPRPLPSMRMLRTSGMRLGLWHGLRSRRRRCHWLRLGRRWRKHAPSPLALGTFLSEAKPIAPYTTAALATRAGNRLRGMRMVMSGMRSRRRCHRRRWRRWRMVVRQIGQNSRCAHGASLRYEYTPVHGELLRIQIPCGCMA